MSPRKKSGYRPVRRNDRNEVGPVVARIRQQLGLTQDELAGRAGVAGWDISRDTIKRIESGERELTDIDLKRLARALRVPVALFFESSDNEPA